MRPFVDATAQLSGSIKTAGRTTVAEVNSMSAKWDVERREKATKILETFGKEWKSRQKLADALVDYSASLAAIAEAGEKGEESAQAVTASFKKLTDAVGVALPQAQAGGVVVNFGSYLYGKFAQDHAAKSLGESMNRLQPVIDEAATNFSASFKQIEDALDAVRDQNDQNVEDEIIEGDKGKVSTLRGRLKHLLARRAALITTLDAGATNRDSLRADLLKAADSGKEVELTRVTRLMNDVAAELAVVESTIKVEFDTLRPIDARKVADRERLTAAINLVQIVRGGLEDWAAAHGRLAAAALEKKPPQVEDLIQSAAEIRELIKTVRAGQNH
ncbi:MAG: hypothetical protein KIS67_20415 [Verrucomicrobiae bacterium]|nr:hypothetical protein [Verrucomicrobiae bacterium]